jgi:hypothetical protein
LIVWAWSIIAFGAVLCGGAFEATSGPARLIFDVLHGSGGGDPDANLRFSLSVMGAVSIGWGIMALGVIRAAIALGEGSAPFWSALVTGTIAWVVIDSALSVAIGFGLNVVPNLALLGGLLLPVFANKLMTKPQRAAR